MKRDPDTIRAILMAVERHAPMVSTQLEIPGTTADSVQYHCRLLGEQYIDYANESTLRQIQLRLLGLTNKGHELVEAIKDDAVWRSIRADLKMDERSVPFQIIEEVALRRARLVAGLPEPRIVVIEREPIAPEPEDSTDEVTTTN